MPFPAIHPALDRALAARGYAEPTPVQAAVLEEGRGAGAGADLLVSAQTGSGKTVAFGLAAAPTLLDGAEVGAGVGGFGPAGAPLMLVIAPTRELAQQVAAELTWLYAEAGARVAVCVGGMDARREARLLAQGAHVVVGTPGRLKDHLDRGQLDPSALRVVVLDEADEMLDMGFREDLEDILGRAPEDRRTLLFSATLARDIIALARRYQRDAVRIDTLDRSRPHGDIEYRVMRIGATEIEAATVNVLRAFEAPGALVFCSRRESVRLMQEGLLARGFASVALSGEMGQRERNEALQALRDGRARVCVATDVAARGLDLPDLGLVIHAEPPVNSAALLHRSGRTGRAGRKGVSVLLAPPVRQRKVEALLRAAGVEAVWSAAPTAQEILAGDETRLLAGSVFEETPSEADLALAERLLATREPKAVAAALIRLMRRDLPAPEALADPGQAPQRRERRAPGDETAPSPWPGDRLSPDEVTWFRLDVGRTRNADPKWLIPLICRLGGITKREIGSIRTFPEETRFEVARTHEAAFLAAIAAASPDEQVRITASEPPTPGSFKAARRAGPFKPGVKGAGKPDGADAGAARPPRKPWRPREADARADGAERPPERPKKAPFKKPFPKAKTPGGPKSKPRHRAG